jgi:DNA transformation protein
MDRDFLTDLFAEFGPVTITRMFSGHGISAGGITFALSLKSGLYLRADEGGIARFEAEGCGPFSYHTRVREVVVRSYWQLPERLYDDPSELADWARVALAAAERAASTRPRRAAKTAAATMRGGGATPARSAKAKSKAKTKAKLKTKTKTVRPAKTRSTGKSARSATAGRVKAGKTAKAKRRTRG